MGTAVTSQVGDWDDVIDDPVVRIDEEVADPADAPVALEEDEVVDGLYEDELLASMTVPARLPL